MVKRIPQVREYCTHPINRFFTSIEITEHCWNFRASKDKKKYAVFTIKTGKTVLAHRFSYELFKGEIPKGKDIDHLCRNKACVNPEHLEAVTKSVNSRRAVPFYRHTNQNADKMFCKRGHELFGDNLTITKQNSRICKKCNLERTRIWQNKNIIIYRKQDNSRHILDRKIKRLMRKDFLIIDEEVVR